VCLAEQGSRCFSRPSHESSTVRTTLWVEVSEGPVVRNPITHPSPPTPPPGCRHHVGQVRFCVNGRQVTPFEADSDRRRSRRALLGEFCVHRAHDGDRTSGSEAGGIDFSLLGCLAIALVGVFTAPGWRGRACALVRSCSLRYQMLSGELRVQSLFRIRGMPCPVTQMAFRSALQEGHGRPQARQVFAGPGIRRYEGSPRPVRCWGATRSAKW